MSRKKQPPAHPSPARLSRLAQQRKRERLTLLAGLVAIFIVVATVGLGYFYISILPRWETVAVVNGTPVRTAYYARLLRLTAGPSGVDPGQLAQLTLRRAIEMELVLQRVPALGVSVTPQEVDEFLGAPGVTNPATAQSGLEESFRAYLRQAGFNPQELRRIAEASLLQEKGLGYFAGQVPGEAEQAHLFVIVVADEGQAQQALERLKAGEDFAAVAGELSVDDASKDKGGEVGWVPRGVLRDPELENAAFTLEPGTLSLPIATPQQYYIAKVASREVREVEAAYREQLGIKAYQQWLEDQRRSSQIVESLTHRREAWAVARASP